MPTMSRSMRHLRWSDDRFFGAIAEVPAEALQARYSPDAWTVSALLAHIVSGAEWYRYCLTGQFWTEFGNPETGADVEVLREMLGSLDEGFIAQAELPDDLMVFQDEHGPSEALRSMLLGQAVLHAAEHKAQICAALEASGFAAPSLDELDLWHFASFEASQVR